MPVQQSNAPIPPSDVKGQASGATHGPNGHRPKMLNDFDKFWQRVSAGLELSELWSQFKRDAQSGYRVYQKDISSEAELGSSTWKLIFQRAKAFMWALLEKLTPARRVLLLIGIVLLILPSGSAHFGAGHHEFEVSACNFQFWGGLLLFILLMLEIAD